MEGMTCAMMCQGYTMVTLIRRGEVQQRWVRCRLMRVAIQMVKDGRWTMQRSEPVERRGSGCVGGFSRKGYFRGDWCFLNV
jgi:hypothetical protein